MIKVAKFGGSSVADAEQFKKVNWIRNTEILSVSDLHSYI